MDSAVPQVSEESRRSMLEVQEQLVTALAELPPNHQEALLAVSTGASMEEAGKAAHMTTRAVSSMLRGERAQIARRLLVQRWALEYGVPRAWKREQLIHIIAMHRDRLPQAAISALRLLAELDGDLESPLLQVNEDNRIIIVTPDSLKQMANEAMKTIEHKE